MTETALQEIEAEANRRWPLEATLIVHRYGRMEPGERIVLVAVGSPHPRSRLRGLRIPGRLAEDQGALLQTGRHAEGRAVGRRP